MSDLPQLWQLRKHLGRELLKRRVLYLDLLYWNQLCDAELGEDRDPGLRELLALLRNAVRSADVVCPIEYNVFTELYKQRLPQKRNVTVRLIDELSDGVVIVSPSDRAFLEILRFMQAAPAGPPFPPAPRDEVWTRPAFIIGHGGFRVPGLTAEQEAELNRQFYAELWRLRLADIVGELSLDSALSFDWASRAAASLNDSKVSARRDFSTYQQLYLSEVRGVLDAYQDAIVDVWRYLFHCAGGDEESVPEEQLAGSARTTIRMIAEAFTKHDLRQQLPLIHVSATLFAHVQWDGPRKYRANDFADFGHAAAALGYCDAFATERPLAALIRQSRLEKEYGAATLSSVRAVIDWLSTRGGPAARG